MSFIDDAKDALGAAGEKVRRETADAKSRLSDKVDEKRAEADVKKAEARRESVERRNEVKEETRDS